MPPSPGTSAAILEAKGELVQAIDDSVTGSWSLPYVLPMVDHLIEVAYQTGCNAARASYEAQHPIRSGRVRRFS